MAVAPDASSGTLLGVARPGIAPTAPGGARADESHALLGSTGDAVDETVDETVDDGGHELGATLLPRRMQAFRMPKRDAMKRLPPGFFEGKRRAGLPKPPRTKASRQALWLMVAGGVIALGSVLFVVFWPDPPPVTAQPRVDESGRDVLEVRCPSCPDGTSVAVNGGQAKVMNGVAQVALGAPIPIGKNRMKIAIDRPEGGQDETIAISVDVAYRISPDLATLQGEKPVLQVSVEALAGTEVTLDGKPLALSNGRAVAAIDVDKSIVGAADEPRTLARQIAYTVKPPDGPREQGVVSVSVGIVQLRIDAPGPSVVIDKESFVLQGRTAKGAQLRVGNHAIPVNDDGTFSREMNVSSIGATQFQVRAKLEGMAPRIVPIAVRRVERLETAAKEFLAQQPVGWAELLGDASAQVGKPVVLTGEVQETHRKGQAVVLLMTAPTSAACQVASGCSARLLLGVDLKAQRGETVTAYGRGAPPFQPEGGAPVPEVQVEFALRGAAPGR
ncbi:Large tegument protein [Chondromyces apiculatus DSM 436]|uniref:Large tegument protein n=1 Tax=Chondromyces apiculatus DSM 436 TaxID=1192034 RepID=A0A017TIG4_9BACT|nr:Large tegument protein [Chondromyces apiculatus DSM 436]